MLFIGLGISMVIMDATIVNVSLPSIIRDLQIGSIDAEWVNAIYSLVFAALLIIAGRLGDRDRAPARVRARRRRVRRREHHRRAHGRRRRR